MTDTPYVLHYAPDNASLVIRLALEEIGAPYRTCLVDRRANAQRAPAYLDLNPTGKIPVLETPHGPLFETAAILLWLVDTHKSLALSQTGKGRIDTLKWLFFLSNTLHPALRMLFYPAAYIGASDRDQRRLQSQTRETILSHVTVLDSHWHSQKTPSVLDLYTAPMLRWIKLYPTGSDTDWFELRDFPALYQMAKNLEMRPSTAAAQAAEGLGPNPFTAPCIPRPPEGHPT